MPSFSNAIAPGGQASGGWDDALAPLWHLLGPQPTLSAEEERTLAERAAQGDRAARERLVTVNVPLVIAQARAYRGLGLPFADLIQEGCCGLIRAIDGFEVARGHRLSTYASWAISRHIQRAIEATGHPVRVPEQRRRLLVQLQQAMTQLAGRQQMEPEAITAEQLAPLLGWSVEQVAHQLALWQTHQHMQHVSLERLTDEENDQAWTAVLTDPDPPPDARAHTHDLHMQLRAALACLTPQERYILVALYELGDDPTVPTTLAALARALKLPRRRVCQVEAEALLKLRTYCQQHGWHQTEDLLGA